MKKTDRLLGMAEPIVRRDVLQGVAIVGGLSLAGVAGMRLFSETPAPPPPPYYPPALTGMRGSHPGSFEAAHLLRDHPGSRFDNAQDAGEELYDLIVVGAGISGLSAAYFYRAENPGARILLIENHDDFGGHAKRNEFEVGGRLQLMNGGTLLIESPTPYSAVAAGLLTALGVDPVALDKACSEESLYDRLGLRAGTFFDRETFGSDRLVSASDESADGFAAFLDQSPFSPAARRDMQRLEKEEVDYFPGLGSDQKKDLLSRMSYQDFLLKHVKVDASLIPYYRHKTDDLWGCGIDAVSAIDCWGSDLPGFQGLHLERTPTNRMGYTPAGFVRTGGSPTFHFPDGNASIARLLVRALIPLAVPGRDARDVVLSRVDYGLLDRPGSAVRIRLNRMALHAGNVPGGVEVVYAPADGSGTPSRVKARHCVLAGWNAMIPYICPELPAAQQAALHKLVKTPLVYTSVALRDWQSFARLKIQRVYAPGCYHSSFRLNEALSIGGYATPRTPAEPTLIRMLRTPAMPGLPEREQHKAGRAELLSTSFETFERETRAQLQRILGPGGFDAARDIAGITVNRWPHGYAPEYNALVDTDTTADRTPNLEARVRCGRIAIANSDSGMAAYTNSAIDQAHRAVHELLGAP